MPLDINDDRLAARVGGAVIALLLIAVALVIGAQDLHLRAQIHFQVFFEEPGALMAGNDVQAASRVIGEVESIRLVTARQATTKGHPLHPAGGIVADVRIEKRYAHLAPRRADYFVSSKGLFGERYLEIGAPMARDGWKEIGPEGLGAPVREGDQIRGVDPPSMDRVLLRSYSNLVTSRLFLREVEPHWRRLVREQNQLSRTLEEIEPDPDAYERLGDAVTALADRLDSLRAHWAAEGVALDDLRTLSTRAGASLEEIERTLSDLEARLDRVVDNIDRLRARVPEGLGDRFRAAATRARTSLARVRHITATARALVAMVERGEGNVGALLHDPEFFDDARGIGKIIKRRPWTVIGHPPE